MSNSKLFIPDKIHVGYQNRKGTYTGKLAYVIYTDKKGKKRKEGSWNSWKDNKISVDDFNNEPMSGFVLNKKTGDYRSRWGGRSAHVRVYDPRDFEIEISVDNLLFILQECSAIKGKGLEGEFIYAWDKKELVLLPVTSQDYQESVEYTDLQDKKVTKKDMLAGCMYTNKEGQELMYIGRHDYYELCNWYYEPSIKSMGKKHIFMYKEECPVYGKNYQQTGKKVVTRYLYERGFTKLAQRLTETADPTFPEEYEAFVKLHGKQKFTKLVAEPAKYKFKGYNDKQLFLKKNEKYYTISFSKIYNDYWKRNKQYSKEYIENHLEAQISRMPVELSDDRVSVPGRHYYHDNVRQTKNMTYDEISNLDLYLLKVKTDSDQTVNLYRN